MADLAAGAAEFAALARRLKDAGETGLRKELYQAINEAARPVAREISALDHLKRYMPDRYAGALAADVAVTTSKITGRDPGIRLVAKSRRRRRKLTRLNEGFLSHPLFGDRGHWYTQGPYGGGMRPAFFSGPAEDSAPQVRDAILDAMARTAAKITGGP